VFEQVIRLELYPKTQTDINLFVLESDGGFHSAALNAATLGLIDAGVAMRDMVVSTTAGLLGSVAVLDLVHQEEKKQNCEFLAAYLLKEKALAHVSLSCNKINFADYEKLINLTVATCEKVGEVLKAAIRARVRQFAGSIYYRIESS